MRFHLDENMNPAVAAGLRRRGIDATTTLEAGLGAASDAAHLEFARNTGRVIVTGDSDFVALARSGTEHCGIVHCNAATSVGRIIEHLVLIHACLKESEMINHVEFC